MIIINLCLSLNPCIQIDRLDTSFGHSVCCSQSTSLCVRTLLSLPLFPLPWYSPIPGILCNKEFHIPGRRTVTVTYSWTLLSCSLMCFANHSCVKAPFLICPFCLLPLFCASLLWIVYCVYHLPSSFLFLFFLLPLFSTVSFYNCIILFQHTIQSV